MPYMKAPLSNIALKSESGAYTMNFHASQPDRGQVLKLFASYAEDIRSSPSSDFGFYDDSQIPLSQWLVPGPFSELGSYESSTQCSSAMLPQPSCDNIYKHFEEPIENPSLWPYDGPSSYDSSSVCTSSDPHFPRNSVSPSLPAARNSYSEGSGVCTSSINEFTNIFDFNFTMSLPNECHISSAWPPAYPSIGSQKRNNSSTTMYSPSPSCSSLDGSEAKSAASRDSSPSQSESDLQRQRRRFPCLIIGCSRRFTSQYTLKVHMEAHKPKPRVSFPCTLGCSERFSRQHDRLRHEVAKHGKICEFLCDDCGRFFSTKKTLGNHKCPVAQGGTRWVNS